jgi:DNA-binding CsgD family transcriptional regulator
MRLQDFFDISQAPDKSVFRRRLVDFAHEMDFDLVSALLVTEQATSVEPHMVYVGNRPKDFHEHAADPVLARKDPVLTRLRTFGLPFMYDQRFYVEHDAGDLWEVAAPYGFKTGICVALRLSDKRQFLLGLDRERPLRRNSPRTTRLLADLQLLAVHAQEAVQRLMVAAEADLPPVPVVPDLTARELEVLRWAMHGKSAWATGELLGLSEHTVNFHFRNIHRKLGVASKHQAVLKALSLNLLTW